MLHIFITGLCLAVALTPTAVQLYQHALGFQPTNNFHLAKVDPPDDSTDSTSSTPQGGWGVPPPPPPGGWPAPPPPPVGWPALPTNDCSDPGTPVGSCPSPDPAQSAYLASSNCECFFQCSNGVAISRPCPSGLYFNPTLNVCDQPANSGCTTTDVTITISIDPNPNGRNTIAMKV